MVGRGAAHRVRVLSLARRGLWLYTHPLLKLLFLPQRCRCKFFSLTETPEDYTIMLDEEGFKGSVQVLQPDGDPRGLHHHAGRGRLQR
uniref:CASTOR1 N-terminal domain-containing protein n=1 Tax=Buteo japonicus TaxID=224669 RepID=A0A8C0AMM0_9AVES